MTYKTLIFFFLICCLFFFGACEKEDYIARLGGNFYSTKIYDYSGSNGFLVDDTSDIVLQCYIEGDSLKILEYSFYIESLGQDYFEFKFNDITCKLTYTNNFNDIELKILRFIPSFNGDEKISIVGTRTNSPRSPLVVSSNEFYVLSGTKEETSQFGNVITNIADTFMLSRYENGVKIIDKNQDVIAQFSNINSLYQPTNPLVFDTYFNYVKRWENYNTSYYNKINFSLDKTGALQFYKKGGRSVYGVQGGPIQYRDVINLQGYRL